MVLAAKDWPDFTNATLLVGVDKDGNPLGVLVDGAGNLTAVLKGMGATGLQTIGVDSDGRIEVFLLDHESQWGDVLRVGNAEMAARLGAAKTWDWRGQQYWFTDFCQGTGNLLKDVQGTGAEISLSPDYWIRGGYSLKLVGGSDGSRYADAKFWIDHPPSNIVGLEIHVSGVPDLDYLEIRLRKYVDNNVYRARLRFNPGLVPDKMQIEDDAGDWQTVGNNFYGLNVEMFNHIKLVADFDTNKYVRALWGDTEVDLSAYSLYRVGAGYLNQMLAGVKIYSRDGENDSKYVDYVLVTVNEPL